MPRRQMCNADRRFYLIHILAAGAARPERVDLQLLVLDDQFNVFVQFRIDEDREQMTYADACWNRTGRCAPTDAHRLPP